MIATETPRLDGPLKVKGEACYAAEFNDARLLYGVVVGAAISKGRIRRLDTAEAEAQDGVVKVFTHQNARSPQVSDEEFRDMVARARLVVGNDSATTHIAARLGVPTVCVFSGVADHRIWRPRGPRVQLVRAPQPCAPCYLGDESRCAYAKACTRDITVPMVLAACHAVLGVPKNRRSSRRATNKSGSAG